jgi:hypothetical protein
MEGEKQKVKGGSWYDWYEMYRNAPSWGAGK